MNKFLQGRFSGLVYFYVNLMYIILFILLLLVRFIYIKFKNIFTLPIPSGMCLFCGPAGSGKTTILAYIAYKLSQNNYKKVVSNVPILSTYELNVPEDFEIYNFTDVSTILYDEAGISANGRKWKSMTDSTIEFIKLFRHHHIDNFILCSQGIDIDQTYLRMCEHIFLVHRSILPNFCSIREVAKDTSIDEISHQICDSHHYVKGGHHLLYMPKYWNMFDSYELKEKPLKEWHLWGTMSRYAQVDFEIKHPKPDFMYT